MNYTPVTGWYYRGLNNRAPAWTGVEELGRFLLHNNGPGPRAAICPLAQAEAGDVLQLANGDGRFYHSLLVIRPGADPLVAAHDMDALGRPLSGYFFARVRALHITGVGAAV